MALTNNAKTQMLNSLKSVAVLVRLLDANSALIGSQEITWGDVGNGSPTGRKIDIASSVQWNIAQGVWPRYVVIVSAGGAPLSDQESTGVSQAYATAGTLTLTNFTVTLL